VEGATLRLFRWKRADQPPDDGEEAPPDAGEGKPSKHGLSADQIELALKVAAVAISAIDPAEKLIRLLLHAL
jgi:hypothetical protein